MESEPNKDKLGDLEKKLYEKSSNLKYKRQKLDEVESEIPSSWKENVTKKTNTAVMQSSILVKLLLFSILFFVVAIGISFYFIWLRPRVISPQDIDILVKAPASVQGGEEVSFAVIVTNDNDVSLESADLRIRFPEGVLIAGESANVDRYTKELGAIVPGQSITESLTLTFFGEENTEKDILIDLEYRADGSSATFSKEKVYTVVLATSPVSLSVNIPAEVNASEDFTIAINTISNSNSVLEDFLVVIDYPFGFNFETASPPPAFGDNVWFLGDMSPSAKKEIVILGSLDGQPNEEKTFKVSTGVQSDTNNRVIDVLYNSFIQTIPIRQPFVAVDFTINGDSGNEISADSGKTITGIFKWKNNTESIIQNGELRLAINGSVVEETSISPDKGFYQSVDNTIIWDQTRDRALQIIEPGTEGSARFSFNTVSLFGPTGASFVNPEIKLDFEFTGERVSPGFPSEAIKITQSKVVKISSALELDSYALYSPEAPNAFINTGPLPPEVEKNTTYTVIWSVLNSSNRISNAQVTASIPLYVTWLGNIAPSSEDVVFNSTTGGIVWNINSIPAGGGKELAFQVGFLPSTSQIGTSPTVLSETELEGFDTFTGASLIDREPSLDTNLRRDSLFDAPGNFSRVVQ